MNKWKQINRGAVLTGLIVVGIVVYLLLLAAGQRGEKPRIEETVRSYTQAYCGWQMLPEEARTDPESLTAVELDAYIETQADVIRGLYIDHEILTDSVIGIMETGLEAQAGGKGVLLNCRIADVSMESYVFDGDRVTVRFTATHTVEYADGGQITDEMLDTMTLQKENGVWKAVSAQLGGYAFDGGMDVPAMEMPR